MFLENISAKGTLRLPICFSSRQNPSKLGSALNPFALRKAKIVYNFGLSECNMVKGYNLLLWEQVLFFLKLKAILKGGNYYNGRVVSPESVSIYLNAVKLLERMFDGRRHRGCETLNM